MAPSQAHSPHYPEEHNIAHGCGFISVAFQGVREASVPLNTEGKRLCNTVKPKWPIKSEPAHEQYPTLNGNR